MKKTLSVFLILASISAFAGDNGGGSLTCKSASGRTKISGAAGVNYNGSGRANLNLEIDGKGIQLNTEVQVSRNGTSTVDAVSFSKKAKVFTLKIIETYEFDGEGSDFVDTLSLLAVPSSFKEIKEDVLTFKATLNGVDPRLNQKDTVDGRLLFLENQIEVNCTLDLSI